MTKPIEMKSMTRAEVVAERKVCAMLLDGVNDSVTAARRALPKTSPDYKARLHATRMIIVNGGANMALILDCIKQIDETLDAMDELRAKGCADEVHYIASVDLAPVDVTEEQAHQIMIAMVSGEIFHHPRTGLVTCTARGHVSHTRH